MNILNKKAFSVLEYTVLFVIVIGGFLVMRNYIQRGIFGTWQQAGQGFGYGRQYDSQKTIECSFDEQLNRWYDRNCFEALSAQQNCNGDSNCNEGVIKGSCLTDTCKQVSQ